VRSRWITCVGLAAACGRIAFDRRVGDAAGDTTIDIGAADAPPPVPALIAMTGSSTGDGSASYTTFPVSFPTANVGHLLVVAVAEHHGDTVTGVVDDAVHALAATSAGAANGGTSSALWYETLTAPTSAVTITINTASNFDVWIAEFSGVKGAPASAGGNCAQYPPTIVSVPGTTTAPNALVFNVLMAAAPMYVSGAVPPFTGLPPLTGNDASYYLAPATGSYAVDYAIASGSGMVAMTCENTAVWVPSL
jgi:hypothetical protein